MGLKRTVKGGIGAIAALAPIASLTARRLKKKINILYYHFVTNPPLPPHYQYAYVGCTPERFDRDLTILKHYFDFVGLPEILAYNRSPRDVGRPLLAVTFDDGFDLVRQGTMEILDRHGVSAMSFVVTSCVGNRSLMWVHKLDALRACTQEDRLVSSYNELAARTRCSAPVATGAQVRASALASWPMDGKEELVDALWRACDMAPVEEYLQEFRPYFDHESLKTWTQHGHGVGLHTHTHPMCSGLSPDQVKDEVEAPAESLKQELDLSEVLFSYPFGVRLPADLERSLVSRGVVGCALGIAGSSDVGTPSDRLERIATEGGIRYEVFGDPWVRPLVRSLRGSSITERNVATRGG